MITLIVAGSAGLSPHGRGNLWLWLWLGCRFGSIPARAGKPAQPGECLRQARVYPRTGGETELLANLLPAHTGLSPHGRGNPDNLYSQSRQRGSIPARAGKPYGCQHRGRSCRVYPRTGGETMPRGERKNIITGLSPHGRGNLPLYVLRDNRGGSIPARAGKPVLRPPAGVRIRVYPRTGGETLS